MVRDGMWVLRNAVEERSGSERTGRVLFIPFDSGTPMVANAWER